MKYKEKLNGPKREKTTISLRQYYFLALWLPIVIPPFLFVYPLHNTTRSQFSFLFYGVIFGMIQYVVFVLWSLFKYRVATTKELKAFSFKAPISFIPFYAVGFILANMISNIAPPGLDSLLIILVLSLLCIPIGYFYVALAHIIGRLLEKIGFIEEEYL